MVGPVSNSTAANALSTVNSNPPAKKPDTTQQTGQGQSGKVDTAVFSQAALDKAKEAQEQNKASEAGETAAQEAKDNRPGAAFQSITSGQ